MTIYRKNAKSIKYRKYAQTQKRNFSIYADLGTKELQAKRKKKETTEALDLCYQTRLINRTQINAAMHLRWLHVLRHGHTANIKAYNPDNYKSQAIDKGYNEKWLKHHNMMYLRSLEILRRHGALKSILSMAVYNQYHPFLLQRNIKINKHNARRYSNYFAPLRSGLDELANFYDIYRRRSL